MRKPNKPDKPGKPEKPNKPQRGMLCDVNAECQTVNFTKPDGVSGSYEKCVCNAGYFGFGGVGKCMSVVDDCDDKCKEKYSDDHECRFGADGERFTCVCKDGMVPHPTDKRRCILANDLDCSSFKDCFAPYVEYGKNLTMEEMKERVMCVDGMCRCTFAFPFVDDYGCCVAKPDKPDKPDCDDDDATDDCDDEPDKPVKTCDNIRCKECQKCINPLGTPMCVCDKENGCTGTADGKRCWLIDDAKCPAESYGTCGFKGAEWPVPINSKCARGPIELEDGEAEIDLNTVCVAARPSRPDKPDEDCKPGTPGCKPDCKPGDPDCKPDKPQKPEKPDCKPGDPNCKPEKPDKPTITAKYGCCQCAKGWEDANKDPSDGCESKIDPCTQGMHRCHKAATCTPYEPEEEEEEEEEEGRKPGKPDCKPDDPDCKPDCKPGEEGCKPDKPTIDMDSLWEKLGYKCECPEGATGHGFGEKGCRKDLSMCDRFGEKRCGKNATCTEIDEKPFMACSCDAGFVGKPPNCVEPSESLVVGSMDDDNSCDSLDYKKFQVAKSSVKGHRALFSGDGKTAALTYSHFKIGKVLPALNGNKYSALLEFVPSTCGKEFIKAIAQGEIKFRITDTLPLMAFNSTENSTDFELYDIVAQKGFYLVNKPELSRAYVQFNKVADTLFKLRGVKPADAMKLTKDRSYWEIKQKLKKQGNKYNVLPAQDSFNIIVLHNGQPIKPTCFAPNKIRFMLWNVPGADGKGYQMIKKNIVDCYFQNKHDFSETDMCSNEIPKCDEVCDDNGDCYEDCYTEPATVFETLFGDNEDEVHVCDMD